MKIEKIQELGNAIIISSWAATRDIFPILYPDNRIPTEDAIVILRDVIGLYLYSASIYLRTLTDNKLYDLENEVATQFVAKKMAFYNQDNKDLPNREERLQLFSQEEFKKFDEVLTRQTALYVETTQKNPGDIKTVYQACAMTISQSLNKNTNNSEWIELSSPILNRHYPRKEFAKIFKLKF